MNRDSPTEPTREELFALISALKAENAALTPNTSEGHAARQVFDLPESQPLVVTEHRAHVCRCESCGEKTRAEFPDGVNAPVQYGARIAAFVVYLLHTQFLPEDRLAQLMRDLFGFGVSLSCATIAGDSQPA